MRRGRSVGWSLLKEPSALALIMIEGFEATSMFYPRQPELSKQT
jgi:hypothetical protein